MVEANNVAKETALNALKRDPIGIFKLAVAGYLDYWDIERLRIQAKSDRGDRYLPKEMLKSLRENFSLAGEDLPFLKTFTNRYFLNALPWYLFLLCMPFLAFVNLLICSRETRRYVFIVFVASSVIISLASSLIEGPTVRYLHAEGWLSFLILGSWFEWLRIKLMSRKLPKTF